MVLNTIIALQLQRQNVYRRFFHSMLNNVKNFNNIQQFIVIVNMIFYEYKKYMNILISYQIDVSKGLQYLCCY